MLLNQQEQGLRQGLWAESEGSGTWIGYYESGKKEGSWSYYEGRSVLKLVRYLDDAKQGPGYKYGPQGNLLLAVEFERDRLHGRVRFFASDGQHIATYVYVYDKLDRVELYVLHDESPSKSKTYLPQW